jgi:hypothetical protein
LDFLETDTETWVTMNSIARKRDGTISVLTEPKPQLPDDLKSLLEMTPRRA